ncbi:MAG: DUF3467 domain-containing protein [Pseudomonadota bacterium]
MSSKEPTAKPSLEGRTIKWDDGDMDTSYANICNISSTREEITLLFGTNLTWQPSQKEVTVQLSNRIVMNPYVAKRLLLMLDATIKNFEATVGELKIETKPAKG